MASSSSSDHMLGRYEHQQRRLTGSSKQYDAFICCRGFDVKVTLVKQLYELLQARGCRVFLEWGQMKWGDSIPFAIRDAICSSIVHIPIFSKAFAESSWCLDELVLMLEQTDALLLPLFYDVKPWELHHIRDEVSAYAAAFSGYESIGKNLGKLEEWKSALERASVMYGFHFSQNKDNLCEEIVSRVLQQIERGFPLKVAKYLVGLDELLEDFERCCLRTSKDKVAIVGIYGIGGSGKTTLAKELFNRKASSFNSASFLSDVRESHARGDLQSLQSKLLNDLFHEDYKFLNTAEGIGKLEDHLGRAKHSHFLIVLDDIDHMDQLDALLPKGMLGSGSLVIITTRDWSMIRDADIRYKMKEMKKDRAKDLFCSHAFHRRDPPTAYEKLVEIFVEVCKGLPLALIVLGAHVYGRNKYYWELELNKVIRILHMDIVQTLNISIDGLNSEEKHIFVDIACFFNKTDISILTAIDIWNASGWSAEHAVQTLQGKCLLELVGYNQRFEMHDHIRDLGRSLACGMHPPRLWRPELLRHMQEKGLGENIEIIERISGRCYNYFWDSSRNSRIEYFTGNSDNNKGTSSRLLWIGVDEAQLEIIRAGIPEKQLQYLELRTLRSAQIATQEVKSSSALSKLYDGKKVKKRKALYEVASKEVGLDDLVEKFESYCQQKADEVKGLKNNIIGIFGVGGSGKTTLAKQIFSRKRSLYRRSSFLFDVQEASVKDDLTSVQNKLLNDLLPGNQPKFSSTKEGIGYIGSALERSPIFSFLIVIDDVDHISQLDALLPKYALTSNSLVIVTTRVESILIQAKIDVRYEIKGMDQQLDRKLFCWHAFHRPDPQRGYGYLVDCFVETCGGSPLSLRVLGGHVFGRSKKNWKIELGKVSRSSSEIKDILKISYDSLGDVEKQIFMDTACFFTEKDQTIGIRIWKASGWNVEDALRTLRNKRLVEVVKRECWNEINNEASPAFVFRMDNLLRNLGREMTKDGQNQRVWSPQDLKQLGRKMAKDGQKQRDWSPQALKQLGREMGREMAKDGQKQRVWSPQDLKQLESKSFSDILKEARGRCFRCFNSIRNKSITYFIENSGTSPTLRWLELNGKDSIPSWVPLQDLVGLRVQGRLPLSLWHQPQAPSQLKELVCKFTDCHYMEKAMLRRNWKGFSDSLGKLNLLESLVLQVESQGNRKDIVIEWNSFEESVRGLNYLRTLGLSGLYINGEIALKTSKIADLWFRLEAITLSNVGHTSKVSISGPGLNSLKLEHMEDLLEVDLIGVKTLKCLVLIQCYKLKKVLVKNLAQLEMLSIEKCSEIEEIPDLSHSNSLQRMRITCCEELQNIRGIRQLSWGESITITCCPKLQSIPGFKDLKGLQYMILSDGGILSFISELQELPSEFTVVMGRAATSFPKADDLTGIAADALYEFQTREEAYKNIKLLSQETQQLFGAIILCAMVDSDDDGSKYMVEGSPGESIDLSWAGGKRIYMIVVSGRKQISSTKYFSWMPTSCTIEKGYILAVNEGQELKTLSILKRLTKQLCTTDAFNSCIEVD